MKKIILATLVSITALSGYLQSQDADALNQAVQTTEHATANWYDSLVQGLQDIYDTAKQKTQELFDNFKQTFSGSQATKKITDATQTAKETVTNATQTATQKASDFAQEAKGAMTQATDKVKNAVQNATTSAKSIGQKALNKIKGVITPATSQGITSKLEQVPEQVTVEELNIEEPPSSAPEESQSIQDLEAELKKLEQQ